MNHRLATFARTLGAKDKKKRTARNLALGAVGSSALLGAGVHSVTRVNRNLAGVGAGLAAGGVLGGGIVYLNKMYGKPTPEMENRQRNVMKTYSTIGGAGLGFDAARRFSNRSIPGKSLNLGMGSKAALAGSAAATVAGGAGGYYIGKKLASLGQGRNKKSR
jgi:hypothetical protein